MLLFSKWEDTIYRLPSQNQNIPDCLPFPSLPFVKKTHQESVHPDCPVSGSQKISLSITSDSFSVTNSPLAHLFPTKLPK